MISGSAGSVEDEASTPLQQLLREEIAAHGPITFARFMEAALYHPAHGYYTKSGEPVRIGRAGDFYTSVSVGPLFGRLLARQFVEMWERIERPPDFAIVEQGAHDGRLARDILEALADEHAECARAVQYIIVEPSPVLQEAQRRMLGEKPPAFDARIVWCASLHDLAKEPVTGVFFSNELPDSFPVHRIVFRGGRWQETYVVAGDSAALEFQPGALSSPALAEAVSALPLPRLEGYTTEVNLLARRWMRDAANVLGQGWIVTIDYGYSAIDYYRPERLEGTLVAYRQQTRRDDVLSLPGECDLTAHVDFTALAVTGEEGGLTTLGWTDQHRFLLGLAPALFTQDQPPEIVAHPAFRTALRAWKTLTHPEMMGLRFQVLIQGKNLPAAAVEQSLAGLNFSRPDFRERLFF